VSTLHFRLESTRRNGADNHPPHPRADSTARSPEPA